MRATGAEHVRDEPVVERQLARHDQQQQRHQHHRLQHHGREGGADGKDERPRQRRRLTDFDDEDGPTHALVDADAREEDREAVTSLRAPPSPREVEASRGPDMNAEPKRRRIAFKDSPMADCITVESSEGLTLVTQAAAAAARRRNALAAAVNRKRKREVEVEARIALARCTEAVNAAIDAREPGEEVQYAELQLPRSSHSVQQAPGIDVIFCNKCGAWSQGRKALRRLGQQCSGDKRRAPTVRLLQLGIMPIAGATIPEHLKKGRGRPRKC